MWIDFLPLPYTHAGTQMHQLALIWCLCKKELLFFFLWWAKQHNLCFLIVYLSSGNIFFEFTQIMPIVCSKLVSWMPYQFCIKSNQFALGQHLRDIWSDINTVLIVELRCIPPADYHLWTTLPIFCWMWPIIVEKWLCNCAIHKNNGLKEVWCSRPEELCVNVIEQGTKKAEKEKKTMKKIIHIGFTLIMICFCIILYDWISMPYFLTISFCFF